MVEKEKLIRAILDQNLATIEDIIRNQGIDINSDIDNGATPLIFAIRQNKYAAFKKLLELGADVNTMISNIDSSGSLRNETPLMVAAMNEEEPQFTIDLIEKGADLNAQNKDGKTALMIAYTDEGLEESITALLNAGTNIELEEWKKQTVIYDAIRRASSYDSIHWLEMLFENGRTPNVNHQDQMGKTPLMTAIDVDSMECIEFLLSKGADIELQGQYTNTALFYAIERGFIAAVETLLEAGAKTTIHAIGFKKHALIEALKNDIDNDSSSEIVRLLLDKGVDVNVKDEEDDDEAGDSPLILAIRKEIDMDIIRSLVEKGADVNYKSYEGETPLSTAIYANDTEVVQYLLEKGADANGDEEIRPLSFAASVGSLQIVKLLVEYGANVNNQNESGSTALLRTNKVDIARFLIENGANVNAKDLYDGMTSLIGAAARQNVELVKLLLEKGADKSIRDAEGKNALDYAKERNYEEIIALLSEGVVEMWKGYTKADADFFNPILDNENNLNDQSICPFCLQYTERESACKYMRHKCSPELRHERLYNLYRSSDGYVVWCAVCGRHCYGHGHFPLTNTTETVRPNLLPFRPGADVYDPKSCPLEGGGGPDEKIKRIDGLLRYICEVQEDVGKRSAKKVREELIEEAWKAAGSRAPKTVRDIRAAKKFNIPCGLPSVATAEPVAEISADIPNPNPLPVKHENAECVVELGVHDDGRPVYEFKHVQPDGSVFNHNDQYICAQDLEELLRNAGGMEDKCPIDLDNCKGKLHPDELKEIYGENSDVYKNYRDRFNEKNKVGGKRRKQSRRRTYRNKKFRGGADGPGIVSKMTDASCALPEKKTAGRRSYKKKPKSRRVTKRHV